MTKNPLQIGQGLGGVRRSSPHPKEEGERHSALVHAGAFVVILRWLTGSLSSGERAGVRGTALATNQARQKLHAASAPNASR